jgi:hypothetical protein
MLICDTYLIVLKSHNETLVGEHTRLRDRSAGLTANPVRLEVFFQCEQARQNLHTS